MSERPWNIVTMGDGTLARLQPWGSIDRIRNADGALHCNHSGDTPCSRSDHETTATYIVEPIDAWPEPPPAHADHRLAQDVGGHPVIPLPVHWRMGAHGDPIAVFDHIVLHLHRDGSVTWSDQSEAAAPDPEEGR